MDDARSRRETHGCLEAGEEEEQPLNIFTINGRGGGWSSGFQLPRVSTAALQAQLAGLGFGGGGSGLGSSSSSSSFPSGGPRAWLRSALDPEAERRRRNLQRRQEVLTLLNTIDQQLLEVARRTSRVSKSLDESFGALRWKGVEDQPVEVVAFLRDAARFVASAAAPGPLEDKLAALERTADCFRASPVELPPDLDGDLCAAVGADADDVDASAAASACAGAVEAPEADDADTEAGGGGASGSRRRRVLGRAELQQAISDLQLNVTVLLESALMYAQHGLAEYKRLLCHVQLLVVEYEPIYRREISAAGSGELEAPLCMDVSDCGGGRSAESMRLADFSKLAAVAIPELAAHARALEQRSQRLRGCAAELRTLLVQDAA